MPIIEGIQIRIPQSSERAERVVAKMEGLLKARYRRTVSRKQFLIQWARLRLALRLTHDYQELQIQVRHDAGGMCEYCKIRIGEHMHHDTPVAFAPRRALDRKNVHWTCVACHDDQDAEARKRVLERTHFNPVSGVRLSPVPGHAPKPE